MTNIEQHRTTSANIDIPCFLIFVSLHHQNNNDQLTKTIQQHVFSTSDIALL